MVDYGAASEFLFVGGHAGVESAAPLLVGGAEVEPPVAWAEVGDEGVVDGVDGIDVEAFGVGGGVLQVYHAAFGHEVDHGSGYCVASAAGGEQEYVAREAAGQEAYFSEGVHRGGVVACAAVVDDYLPEFRGVGGAVYCYAVALHAQGGAPHEAPLCPFGEGHNGGKVTDRHLRSGAEHGVDVLLCRHAVVYCGYGFVYKGAGASGGEVGRMASSHSMGCWARVSPDITKPP